MSAITITLLHNKLLDWMMTTNFILLYFRCKVSHNAVAMLTHEFPEIIEVKQR